MLYRSIRTVLQATAFSAAVALIGGQGAAVQAAPAVQRDLSSTAQAVYQAIPGGPTVTIQSNSVHARFWRRPARLAFRNHNFSQDVVAAPLVTTLQLEADAPTCNTDSSRAETVIISVTSSKTGDTEDYVATETSANSGVFRTGSDAQTAATTRQARSATWVDTGQTEVDPNDILTGKIAGCGEDSEAWLLIDPSGIVFDSVTDEPLAGATVTLIDVTGAGNGGNAGGLATVFAFDGVTPSPNPVVSGINGAYAFPQVAASDYQLRVVPPSTSYDFPSQRAPSQLSSSRTINQPGSFGGTFPVNAMTGAVTADLPVDPHPRALRVTKTASRNVVEIAETLEYVVTVQNVGEFAIDATTLHDDLPFGFSYVPGTARLDGAAIADPFGGRGPALDFDVGGLAVSAKVTLRYRVLVGPNAMQGDGVNRAQARSTQPETIASNLASAKVTVQPGVFSDRAFVLGVVFADCNRNGVKDPGEPGVPGVRLFLEDGSFVSTDGEGRYSLYGLRPVTHVLKVDSSTLPQGAKLAAISQRNAGDGNSRFIDVKKGELHRADFALNACTPPLLAELQKRRARQSDARELATSIKAELRTDTAPRSVGDARALPSSGLVGGNPTSTPSAPAAPAAAPTPVAKPAAGAMNLQLDMSIRPVRPADVSTSAVVPPTLEHMLATVDAKPGFVGVRDGEVLPAIVPVLRVKGRAGAKLSLEVNGQPVAEDRIGERVRSEETQTELREYIGIALRPGANRLTIVERDGFGNVRGGAELTVRAAGPLAKLRVTPPTAPVASDGSAIAQVTVSLLDADDLPVLARTEVTLQSDIGVWDVTDLDANQPGVQTFVENGQGVFGLRSPQEAGEAKVRASAGRISGESRVGFAPDLREMLAVGVVEGRLDLRKLKSGSIVPARSNDGFEEELREFARGDNTSASGRAAVFLKGKIKGDALLTIGYDSDKQTRERLFRDIQPDEFYPVYGDSSVRGFDAQSTGRLYVKIEKNRSWLLYGDLTTQSVSNARQLGAYQRSLTGVKQHYETDQVVVNAFASQANSRQMSVELRGNGTSGPYLVTGGAAIANSEKVEILVRDRNQPALVIRSTPQARFADYDFEPYSGQLLFRSPVPSLDADLNPISIRVTYEVEQSGEKFWVAGVDAQVQVAPELNVGGSVVRDENPLDKQELLSANATATPPSLPKTRATIEGAQMTSDLTGKGNAQRGEVVHDGDQLKARVYASRSTPGFVNPASPISSGREEAGAKGSYALDQRTRVVGEAINTADTVSGARREGAKAGIERSFDGGVKVEVGGRFVHDMPVSGREETETTSVRTKLSSVVPGLPKATVYGEAEQDVNDSDKRMLAVGGEYQFGDRGRAYVRHEVISSLTGPYDMNNTDRSNTTVVGVDGSYMKDGRMFSEYRGRDGFEGRETEAAIGLRNQIPISEGLRMSTSLERVTALSGNDSNESLAVTGAVEYTRNPLMKTTGRLEFRNSETSRSLLSTAGVAYKINSDWTLLTRNVYAQTTYHNGDPDRVQERFQIGAAFRDTERNLSNGLARYEFKHEDGMALGEGARNVHSMSVHADWQPNREMVYTLQQASKFVDERVEGIRVHNSAHLLSARATRDLKNGWDAGLTVRMLTDGRFASRQYGLGAEVGYLLKENLWVSGGYNFIGFHDRDLASENDTQRGLYMRLRFKFDETLMASDNSKGSEK